MPYAPSIARWHAPRPNAKLYDRARGGAGNRGYGARWQRVRAMQLRRHPLCVVCGTVATDVDHITPKHDGGLDEKSNLQSLCKRCHGKKTRSE